MDIGQRQKWIIDQLNKQGNIRISSISQKLNVSRETIRKDIYALDQQGILQAVRGGAILPSTVRETKYDQRTHMNLANKKEIARNAIRFIRDGDSIFLDYGSSSAQVAEAIRKSKLKDLTVITSSIYVLQILGLSKNVHLIILGGSVRQSEGSVSGPLALANIGNVFCDVGFFGCGGINLNAGITNYYFDEVEVSKHMMSHCRIKIVLADHTKFTQTALYKTANISSIDVVITDNQIENSITKEMRLANVSFINGMPFTSKT